MIKLLLYGFIAFCIVSIIVSSLVAFVRAKKQGKKIGKRKKENKESHVVRLLFKLPYQYVTDMFNRGDYEFTDNGFHLITGEQGCGKTITLVYLLRKYQKQFPDLKVRTNMCYKYEDGPIDSWKDLVFKNNGIHGQIDCLDEVQNWFNSLQSKNFPVEMMAEISQQRKQRKMIFGTSQVWQRVAKPIREQVKLVYKPMTLFGCLTIVIVCKPVVNSDGECETLKFRKAFYFVHDEKLRDSFDTFLKIKNMSLAGFKDQPSLSANSPQSS